MNCVALSEFTMKWTVWHCQSLQWIEQYGVGRICNYLSSMALSEFAITWAVWHCQNLQLLEQYDSVRICNYLSSMTVQNLQLLEQYDRVRIRNYLSSMTVLEFAITWAVWLCQNLQLSAHCGIVRICNYVSIMRLPRGHGNTFHRWWGWRRLRPPPYCILFMPLQPSAVYVSQSIALVVSDSCQYRYPCGHWLETRGECREMRWREKTKSWKDTWRRLIHGTSVRGLSIARAYSAVSWFGFCSTSSWFSAWKPTF
jgi:hypothetical protein